MGVTGDALLQRLRAVSTAAICDANKGVVAGLDDIAMVRDAIEQRRGQGPPLSRIG